MRSVFGTARRTSDEGFTLIEVVAALSIIVIVSTAALYFFVGGTRAITHQQRTQDAVSIANGAMEDAFAVVAKTTNGISGVLKGRTQDAATAAWTLGTTNNVDGISRSYLVWDTTAAANATPAVPITTTSKHSNAHYTATTIIGSCYRSNSGGASAPCGKLTGYTNDPGTAPSGYAKIMRVMVLVTWPSTAGTCTGGTCSFQTSSLIDPNDDQVWNNTTKPIAVDDAAVVYAGQSTVVSVLDNDIIGPVTVNPVNGVTVTSGTGTTALQGNGSVKFTAPSNASGKMTFTYYLKDGAGRQSNTATVTVSVMPVLVNDSYAIAKSDTPLLDVTTNDMATPASIQITTAPTGGPTVSVSGLKVKFTTNNKVGTFTFQYKVTDTSGLVSDVPATVTVVVSNWAAPKVADLTIALPSLVNANSYLDLTLASLTGNPTNYIFKIASSSVTQGQLRVGSSDYNSGNNYQGTSISYRQQSNVVGQYTFIYQVLDPDGLQPSATKTVTIQILPVATNDTFTVTHSTSKDLTIGSNDAPQNFNGQVVVDTYTNPVDSSGKACGSFTSTNNLQNGTLTYQAPSTKGTCTFTYNLKSKSTSPLLKSATTATVTITVN